MVLLTPLGRINAFFFFFTVGRFQVVCGRIYLVGGGGGGGGKKSKRTVRIAEQAVLLLLLLRGKSGWMKRV